MFNSQNLEKQPQAANNPQGCFYRSFWPSRIVSHILENLSYLDK